MQDFWTAKSPPPRVLVPEAICMISRQLLFELTKGIAVTPLLR